MASRRTAAEARQRGRSWLRGLWSLAAVGAVAAVIGYGLGLYLTGALTGADRGVAVDHPEPQGAVPATAEPGPTPPTPPANAGAEPVVLTAATATVYVAQLGAFSMPDNAARLVEAAAAAGFGAVAVHVEGGHRVWSGAFTSREDGRPYADRLSDAGFPAYLTERKLGGRLEFDAARDGTALERLGEPVGELPPLVLEAAQSWSRGTPASPWVRRVQAQLEVLGDPSLAQGEAAALVQELQALYTELAELGESVPGDAAEPDPRAATLAMLVAEVEQLFHAFAERGDGR